jgi:fermentation-respiration switch protein FrsA (DUF1100 family)
MALVSNIRSIGRIMAGVLLFVVSSIIVSSLVLLLLEEKFIYHPSKYPDGNWQPESYGLSAEECFFMSDDNVRLHGWFFSTENPGGTLLWFHGNAGNITHRLDNVRRLLALDVNIFIFDYRGYGKSEGSPSEKGLYADGLAAYDYLVGSRKIDPTSIILFGRSMGAVVAVHAAANRPCRGLVVESGFSSARDMAKTLFPVLPLQFFLRSKFDAETKIRNIQVPTLFLHGTEDRTVPIELGRKLYDRSNGPKSFHEIIGAGHNDTYLVGGSSYFKRLGDFFEETLPSR